MRSQTKCDICGRGPFKRLAQHKSLKHNLNPDQGEVRLSESVVQDDAAVAVQEGTAAQPRPRHKPKLCKCGCGEVFVPTPNPQKYAPGHKPPKNHKKTTQLTTKKQTPNLPNTLENDHHERHEIPAEIFAYAVGKFEEACREIAFQNDLPGKQFTRGCAEYFIRASRR